MLKSFVQFLEDYKKNNFYNKNIWYKTISNIQDVLFKLIKNK